MKFRIRTPCPSLSVELEDKATEFLRNNGHFVPKRESIRRNNQKREKLAREHPVDLVALHRTEISSEEVIALTQLQTLYTDALEELMTIFEKDVPARMVLIAACDDEIPASYRQTTRLAAETALGIKQVVAAKQRIRYALEKHGIYGMADLIDRVGGGL